MCCCHPSAAGPTALRVLLHVAICCCQQGWWLQSAAAARPVQVHIVEQHKDALQFWPTSAPHHPGDDWAEPITLVHFDSHNDLMDVEASEEELQVALREAFDDWSDSEAAELAGAGSLPEKRAHWLESSVTNDWPEIGNFITFAVWFGYVDRVLWIRSDFPGPGVYNGPKPGEYKIAVELVEVEESSSSLCLREVEVLKRFEDPPLRGSNFSTEISTCQHEHQASEESEQRIFDLVVMTVEQLQVALVNGTRAVQLLHAKAPLPRQWVLDIDLDVFATYDPPYTMFLEANFSEEFARNMSRLFDTDYVCSEEDVQAKQGYSDACGCLANEGVDDEVYQDLLQRLGDLPFTLAAARASGVPPPPSADTKAAVIRREVGHDCELPVAHAAQIYDILAGMTSDECWRWRSTFQMAISDHAEEDFALSFLQGLAGIHHASSQETRRHMRLFHSILLRLAADALLGRPEVVTVSRSMSLDRYLPKDLWPWIETRALDALDDMLRTHGGHEVVHHKDVEPLRRAGSAPGAEGEL